MPENCRKISSYAGQEFHLMTESSSFSAFSVSLWNDTNNRVRENFAEFKSTVYILLPCNLGPVVALALQHLHSVATRRNMQAFTISTGETSP
jgi:hypothetical protein